MRLATFNVFSGRSPDDGAVDPDRYADAVASLDADLLALQEVDRGQPRSHGLDLTALAADAMGAVAHRFEAALAGTPGAWSAATGQEAEGTPAYGVAVLSRLPVTRWGVVRLPPLAVRVPYLWPGDARPSLVRDEPRVAVVAEVQVPGGALRFVGTHLSFLPVSNGRQLRGLMHALGDGPVLLAGDLNMGPRRAHRLTGARPLAAGPTYPQGRPVRQIDHLLVRGDLTGSGGPVRLPVSDHRALVADIAGHPKENWHTPSVATLGVCRIPRGPWESGS